MNKVRISVTIQTLYQSQLNIGGGMRKFIKLWIVLMFLSTCLTAQLTSSDITTQADKWIEDLEYLTEKVGSIHPNPYMNISKEDFEMKAEHISLKIPGLSDYEIIVEMMDLTSSIGDGHTRLHGKQLTDLWFPVRMEMFEEGLFVTAASQKYQDLIGKQVVRIGEYPAIETFYNIAEIVPHDNEQSQVYNTTCFLTMASILKGLNIISDNSVMTLVIESGGEKIKIEIESNKFNSDEELSWFWRIDSVPDNDAVRFIDIADSTLPFFQKNRDKFYWFEYLHQYKSVYFCFNVIADSPEETFADFHARLWQFIEANEVEKLIIDLRNNLGGNNQIVLPMIEEIIKHPKINRAENLFVIVGRKTWSAAMHFATWLDRHTNAMFAGEPTGSAPNHFADPKIMFLPNSKIMLMVSRYYWQNSWPWDERNCIEPEINIPLKAEDFFQCEDPVLKRIISFEQ